MTTLTLDLEQFTKSLEQATNRSLGWVWLQPITHGDESLPSYIPDPPAVMPSFVLIDADTYRFSYKSVRYARLCYLLERDGTYEAGELTAIHDLIFESTNSDEPLPPSEPLPFVPPTITTSQVTTMGSVGSLGVLFSFLHDPDTGGGDAKFGLAYKITNALPAVFPRLVMAYITALPPEDI